MANSKLTYHRSNQTESKFKIYKVKKRKKRFAYPKLSPPQLRLISPLQLLVSSAASSRLFVPSSDRRFQPRERERERNTLTSQTLTRINKKRLFLLTLIKTRYNGALTNLCKILKKCSLIIYFGPLIISEPNPNSHFISLRNKHQTKLGMIRRDDDNV